MADRQVFRTDKVTEVVNGGPDNEYYDRPIEQDKRINAGTTSLHTESDLDRYEVVEAYLQADIDGSGINSKIVLWVHLRSGAILGGTYLRRINKSGEVPIFKIDFHKRPGQTYGVGIIEMIHPLSRELDAIHNIKVDSGIISNMPVGFYRATSSIDPTTIQYEPGTLIPVDDPQRDIVFPQMGNKTAFGFQEEQALQSWIERMTGMNDMSLGVMTGAQGATRTATGARALIGEANTNLDIFLRRCNNGWRSFLTCLWHMLQQRTPNGLAYRVTGESGNDYFGQVRHRDDLAGDYDFDVDSNSSNSNKQVQMDQAQQIVQMTANPLDIQIGVITPAQRFEAMKNWYKANGVKEWGRYVQKPPDYQYIPTPSEELDRIFRGVAVQIQPNSDHQGYLALWEEFKNSDDLLGQIDEQMTIAAEKQARQHQAMMQAVQAQQAQQANSDQMRMNAAQSQQQAPTGLSPLAQGAPNAPQQ